MIENTLLHFKTKTAFNTELEAGNIQDQSITFIKDSKEIVTHGDTYKTVNWSVLKPKEALVGDVCLYDKNADKLIIVSASEDLSNYSSDSYSPVGVVVIPGSHDVYGDGSCGVMSLKEMNYTTPDTGSTSYQDMRWGYNSLDISSLTNYDVVCHVGNNGTVNESVQGTIGYAYLPSDKFSTVQNPYDTDTYYNYNDSDYYIPSPYNDDDTRNPAYYQTSSPSSTGNAMSDFNGKNNTNIITALATAESWKTASSITNSYSSGYYPAACCCWRYHTDGTKQGQWYLPACGELGYIMPKFNQIQASINALRTAYGDSVGVQLNSDYSYWSSSEYGDGNARSVYTDSGLVSNDDKFGYLCVRAWLRVKP